MKIFFFYTLRNLWQRRLTTILTVGGIALVVFVFAAALMLAYGVEKTLVETGSEGNVIATRKAASGELSSQIGREAVAQISTFPEIKLSSDGKPLVTADLYTLINLRKIGSGDMGNVTLRGVSPQAFQLRKQFHLREGRMFRFGTNEIVVGSSIASRFVNAQIGHEIKFAGDMWQIVGVFDADKSGFESEIWGNAERMLGAFNRPVYSSLTFSLRNEKDLAAVRDRIERDPRLNYVEVATEKEYYKKQSEAMSMFISVLGTVITVIFSLGAMIGAMITMYSAVANRTIEIGTIRALGFHRRTILGSFLLESLLLSLIGAGAGLFLASFMQFFTISTVNFSSFTELAFGFALSPSIVITSLIFAVIMGIIGGVLPAFQAARKNIVAALRSI